MKKIIRIQQSLGRGSGKSYCDTSIILVAFIPAPLPPCPPQKINNDRSPLFVNIRLRNNSQPSLTVVCDDEFLPSCQNLCHRYTVLVISHRYTVLVPFGAAFMYMYICMSFLFYLYRCIIITNWQSKK